MINECPSINQLKRWEVSRDGKWELMVRRVDVNCRAPRGPEGPQAERMELNGKAGFRGRPAWGCPGAALTFLLVLLCSGEKKGRSLLAGRPPGPPGSERDQGLPAQRRPEEEEALRVTVAFGEGLEPQAPLSYCGA